MSQKSSNVGALLGRAYDLSLWAALSQILFLSNAHAYVDPGAGSVLTQLVLGGVAGLFVIVKLYWGRFRALFSRKKDK